MSSDDDHLVNYLEKVRQIPLLASRDEAVTLKRAREGDESARKRVIEGYLEVTALLALDWRQIGCALLTPSRKETSFLFAWSMTPRSLTLRLD